jgi:hypothetical protein
MACHFTVSEVRYRFEGELKTNGGRLLTLAILWEDLENLDYLKGWFILGVRMRSVVS